VSLSGLDSYQSLTAYRGEQTASALERQLDGIESRIDELLAAAEASANANASAGEAEDNSRGFSGRLSNENSKDTLDDQSKKQ